jgi:hypothetical protein
VFPVPGGTAALVYQALGQAGAPQRRGGPGGPAVRVGDAGRAAGARRARPRRAGPARLTCNRERAERYRQDRGSWRARLRQYASARNALVTPGDGWWPLDDEDDWPPMLLSRWPVLSDDFVRGPPAAGTPKTA